MKSAEKLQGYLDDPIPTWMENDANCAAMAEKLSGNAVKLDDFALITMTAVWAVRCSWTAGSAEARIGVQASWA